MSMSAKARGRLFLAISVVSGVVAVLLTQELVRRDGTRARNAAAPVIETEPVLVAGTDLAAGEPVSAGQVSVARWPKGFLPAGSLQDPEAVERRILKRAIQKDEPILESALAPPGAEAGLGSLITSERRAMAVKVDPVVIVAGFVRPGSRVDVIATIRTERGELPATGLILQDLKVLAIDQKLEDSGSAEAELASVVTLEVTPDEAQKLAHAAKEGSLQLTLRNPIDNQRKQLPGITGTDVIPEPADPRRRGNGSIEEIRGSKIGPPQSS
jgi:pilus assembly protein CpaB